MSEVNYYFSRDGQEYGPFDFEALAKHNLPPETLVRSDNREGWYPIGSLDEFIAFYESLDASQGTVPMQPVAQSSELQSKPSVKVMLMRFIALICAFSGVVLMLVQVNEFNIVELVAGIGLIATSIMLFKKNRVNYSMSSEE
ncbi:MAG: DUF4339 domain-containing protein [Gammaproteobacteria bacterium]|nr:DUF4339 domain-containing protein [Gammaproteobacteria bacterium]